MQRGALVLAAIFGGLTLLAPGMAAQAAEVNVFCAFAMQSVLEELGPQFERATGHKLVLQFEAIGVLKRQIDAGEHFDVAMLTPSLIDALVKEGKIATGTRTDIARSGLGVFVRTGAPRPDISSAEAFKRALLNAKSITYTKEGATATYLASLFARLGIAEQMQPKTHWPTGRLSQFVADGEAELGLVVIGGFHPVPGAELLGPFPPELQNYVVYTAGVGSGAKAAEAGKALLTFLQMPAAVPVLKSKGMEPMTP